MSRYVESEHAWRLLRMLRSDPPGLASSEERREVFVAALDQSEELWRAAEAIGASARPIVLFYSLVQGARALTSSVDASETWQRTKGHGLSLGLAKSAELSLSEILVRPKGTGAVQQISTVIGSPMLAGSVDLASLLVSLPEHAEMLLSRGAAPRPLELTDVTATERLHSSDSGEVVVVVGPLPRALLQKQRNSAGYLAIVPLSVDQVADWFDDYPRLRRAGRPSKIGFVNPMALQRNPRYCVRVHWELPQPVSWDKSHEWFRQLVDVLTVEPPESSSSTGLALPTVGESTGALAPLIGWWIALYACSMLARYHPRAWIGLLDVDRSAVAVPMGIVLDVAARRLPSLLLEQLVRAPSSDHS